MRPKNGTHNAMARIGLFMLLFLRVGRSAFIPIRHRDQGAFGTTFSPRSPERDEARSRRPGLGRGIR
jgi:hypothetical protein